MWVLKNSTPYQADRGWVRDMSGREVWLVAVRARFRIVPGAEAVWDPDLRQDPVRLAPEFEGDGIRCHLVADTDLVHEKPATDILLHGHARPLRGHMAKRVAVRMQVGTIDKRAVVYGDRVWSLGGPSDPKPFTEMPLSYTRAFGGPDLSGDPDNPTDWYTANPAGVWYGPRLGSLEGQPLPNIEDPSDLISGPGDRPRPVGFGAISPHWPDRARYAGTYDAAWEKSRQPLLPTDFDPRFHQQAPPDQQVPGHLRGGERVRLEGVHPDGPLDFFLPRVSLAFETLFDDTSEERHSAKLHTVEFEPDFPAVSMVWHSSLECHTRVNLLSETRIWERARLRLTAQ